MAIGRPASLARRALPALAIAGLSGGILVKLDQPGTPGVAAGARAATGTKTAARSAAGATPTTRVVPPATTVSPAPSPATSAGSGRAATPTTARPATIPATTAVPAGTATAARDCSATPTDGPVVTTRWGPVQVAATFTAGGALCNIQTLQSPSDHRKSVAINQQALPILRREALAAGSANIDVVSGATITSDAYATSLQSILDGNR